MNLLQALDRRFTGYADADDQRYHCLLALIDLGLLSICGTPARKLVDKDPIEQIRIVKDVDEANALLLGGWKLLGASSTEPFEIMLARPKSVAAEEPRDDH